MRAPQVILALIAAATLALGAGTALAASGSPATEAAKAPAVAAPAPAAKTPAVKMEKAKESPPTQKAEKAREEKGEKEVTIDRVAEGVVTHVEPTAAPPTLVMKTMAGKEELIVGVDVPANTIIREGKTAKQLEDIHVGDRVWMRWDRLDNRLVADQIHILKANFTAAMKTAPAKQEHQAAAKTETPKTSY
jgi:hypothetical protein